MHHHTHPKPMMKPPSALHPVPIRVTPPLVPGGTFLPFVTRIGHPLESIPSSDASVSAKLVAWCAIREHAKADGRGLLAKSIPHGIELQNIGARVLCDGSRMSIANKTMTNTKNIAVIIL
jgi:hypothetical protein